MEDLFSSPHATRCAECREECRERGYNHLHRQLNDSLLLVRHSSRFGPEVLCLKGFRDLDGRDEAFSK